MPPLTESSYNRDMMAEIQRLVAATSALKAQVEDMGNRVDKIFEVLQGNGRLGLVAQTAVLETKLDRLEKKLEATDEAAGQVRTAWIAAVASLVAAALAAA